MMHKSVMALAVVILPILFVNCAPAFNTLDLSSLDGSNDTFNIKLNDSLMTASQTYMSMAELTGVVPNNATRSEFESRSKTSLSESHSVAAITAPIMMTTANLGSRFCEQVIQNEKAQAAAERRFFSKVDFGSGLMNLNDETLDSVTRGISLKIWGREPTADELAAFREFKLGFYAAIDANQKNNAGQTERFAFSLCTAALATYEAMSL